MLASRFGLRAGEAVLGGHLSCPSTVVIAIPAGAIARQEMILDCGSLHNFRAKLSAHAKASAASISEFPATFLKGGRYRCKQRFDNDANRDILVIDVKNNFNQRCSSEPR